MGSGLLALVHLTGGDLMCGVKRLQRPLNHFFRVFIVATLQLFVDEPFGVGFERDGHDRYPQKSSKTWQFGPSYGTKPGNSTNGRFESTIFDATLPHLLPFP